nr:unnamed protein product [Callosobruchus analis]
MPLISVSLLVISSIILDSSITWKDLKIFREYLTNTANSALEKLEANKDVEDYTLLLETVFCRVLILNRRRPGELQRLPLYVYEEGGASEDQTYEEFSDLVTTSEKILMKTLKRVVIRGKRGRGVPVLFPSDVQAHIKNLLKNRNLFHSEPNIYLFGNPKTPEPICGYKTLRKHAQCSGVKQPSAITSTRLRKHLATLTQIFNISDSEIEQLAAFMGHTVGVHRGSYRLPDDVYQTAKLSKLLLLMEKGDSVKFKGQSFENIELDMGENLLDNDNGDESDDELWLEETISSPPLKTVNQPQTL